ncbi:2Fe-2S iron-sulfur cluster binding domain-containing protein [Streptomyces sp. SID10853]|uniref:2Fe-2S iron-sulfur cluster-binding protein n=1 Tax=Streptomyces sp. SID10853 TaxID=2706028 RepID=UPI0013C1D4AF|nr:2Fe-2S iron-sulfur cluster binding domain-containing protein [Streptomyces sp. SID10853]
MTPSVPTPADARVPTADARTTAHTTAPAVTRTPPLAEPSGWHRLTLTVNGRSFTAQVESRLLLSDFLRDRLGLTGTHVGCEHGVCGACTVLIDDVPSRSCLTLAVQCEGTAVRTVESLAPGDAPLSTVQRAFHECHGMQCGFCTAGFLMTATALTEQPARPDDEQVADALSGHLCRCTGYRNIRRAVCQALDERFGE